MIDWFSVSVYIRLISISHIPVGHQEYRGLINSSTQQRVCPGGSEDLIKDYIIAGILPGAEMD